MFKTLAATADDRRGGVAIIFAIVLPILLVLAIGTIDLYRIAVVKQQLQDALDASTLLAARSSAAKEGDLEKIGDAAFAEMIASLDVNSPSSTFKLGTDNDVVGAATGKLQPMLVGMFSGGVLDTKVETVVKRAVGTPIELALVLDTTGSMEDQPIKDLQIAAKDLVKKLHEGVTEKDAVKIAVVPFGQYVNVGVSRRYASWMSVPPDWTETITPKPYQKQTCQKQTYPCTKTNDGKSKEGTCTRNVNCKLGDWEYPKPYPKLHTFHGCAGSPAHPKNVEDSDASRVYPGFLDLKCGAEFTPLTSSKATVDKAIGVLTASGFTYIPSGLAWGFNMLSQPTPMTEAAAYDKTGENQQPRKALVLMTDGANTRSMNAKNGLHDNNNTKQANDYTAELCKNIKAKKIEVFTVAFQVDDNSIKTILEACSSDKDTHYFDASNAAALQEAFLEIAMSLKSIRIAK